VTDTRIHVVEDDRLTAEGMARTLTRPGFIPLAPVSSGEEAIQRAAHMQPDLALMGIKLQGDLDGAPPSASTVILDQPRSNNATLSMWYV